MICEFFQFKESILKENITVCPCFLRHSFRFPETHEIKLCVLPHFIVWVRNENVITVRDVRYAFDNNFFIELQSVTFPIAIDNNEVTIRLRHTLTHIKIQFSSKDNCNSFVLCASSLYANMANFHLQKHVTNSNILPSIYFSGDAGMMKLAEAMFVMFESKFCKICKSAHSDALLSEYQMRYAVFTAFVGKLGKDPCVVLLTFYCCSCCDWANDHVLLTDGDGCSVYTRYGMLLDIIDFIGLRTASWDNKRRAFVLYQFGYSGPDYSVNVATLTAWFNKHLSVEVSNIDLSVKCSNIINGRASITLKQLNNILHENSLCWFELLKFNAESRLDSMKLENGLDYVASSWNNNKKTRNIMLVIDLILMTNKLDAPIHLSSIRDHGIPILSVPDDFFRVFLQKIFDCNCEAMIFVNELEDFLFNEWEENMIHKPFVPLEKTESMFCNIKRSVCLSSIIIDVILKNQNKLHGALAKTSEEYCSYWRLLSIVVQREYFAVALSNNFGLDDRLFINEDLGLLLQKLQFLEYVATILESGVKRREMSNKGLISNGFASFAGVVVNVGNIHPINMKSWSDLQMDAIMYGIITILIKIYPPDKCTDNSELNRFMSLLSASAFDAYFGYEKRNSCGQTIVSCTSCLHQQLMKFIIETFHIHSAFHDLIIKRSLLHAPHHFEYRGLRLLQRGATVPRSVVEIAFRSQPLSADEYSFFESMQCDEHHTTDFSFRFMLWCGVFEGVLEGLCERESASIPVPIQWQLLAAKLEKEVLLPYYHRLRQNSSIDHAIGSSERTVIADVKQKMKYAIMTSLRCDEVEFEKPKNSRYHSETRNRKYRNDFQDDTDIDYLMIDESKT